MLKAQMIALNRSGTEMLAKANVAGSIKDVREFSELGLRLLAESRSIFEQLRVNSLVMFLEISFAAGYRPRYEVYLDFCTRNALDFVSKQDFDCTVQSNGSDSNLAQIEDLGDKNHDCE